ncbi:disulfide bond formation protein B [Undibacter mobilis]|uniref:Disulfide bond formation protein B n=1 Tax=Undibacter mobilis TaxID=2292256 RepID=A0A371B8E8_9BRAD|nr:disulfide bond formation protein B [Undibacter mobilis]RDV03703.1 disulfide bond formation protein B [Undibacter mobilis]
MITSLPILRKDPVAGAAAIVALVGLATIGGFLFFEHVLGYMPCALCLDQRKAFYVTVPLAALLCLGAGHGASRKVLFLGFLVIAAAMLWNTGLAAFHAGVEWKFWPGPADCSGPVNNFGSAGDMLNRLQTIRIARCDDAAWRLFGISMAGYDVLISAFLAAVAAFGAKAALARPEPE